MLEKQGKKQKALVRLIERNWVELHPKASAILEKLAGSQAELRESEARLVFRSGFRLGMQLAAEALTNQPELYEE